MCYLVFLSIIDDKSLLAPRSIPFTILLHLPNYCLWLFIRPLFAPVTIYSHHIVHATGCWNRLKYTVAWKMCLSPCRFEHTRCSIYSSVIVDMWFFVSVRPVRGEKSNEYRKHQLSWHIWEICVSVMYTLYPVGCMFELNSFGKQFYQCVPLVELTAQQRNSDRKSGFSPNRVPILDRMGCVFRSMVFCTKDLFYWHFTPIVFSSRLKWSFSMEKEPNRTCSDIQAMYTNSLVRSNKRLQCFRILSRLPMSWSPWRER